MGGGGGNTTTIQKSDPWEPTQDPLKTAISRAEHLFKVGAFAPPSFQDATGGSRIADLSDATRDSLKGTADLAKQGMSGPNMLNTAASGVEGVIRGDKSGNMRQAYQGLSGAMGGSSLRGTRGTLGSIMSGRPTRNFSEAAGTLRGQAGGDVNGMIAASRSGLRGMMEGGATNPALEAAKENALASAIPAAASMFSGSGMANSSAAMDTVGRAAMDAVAPYEYQAANQSLDRSLAAGQALGSMGTSVRGQDQSAAQALGGLDASRAGQQLSAAGLMQGAQSQDLNRQLAGAGQMWQLAQWATDQSLRAAYLAPQAYQSQFLPSQMLGQVGAVRDGRAQDKLNEKVDNYYTRRSHGVNNLTGFTNLLLGAGGQGGTATGIEPGASGAQRALGAGLTGLGTYGSLAAMGMGGPLGIAGGIGAGLMGLF
jgi:hypothetical protein